jgi:hypothetical protein
MKPRTIWLITVAGTLGMLITVGVPLAFLTHMLHRPAVHRVPFAGRMAQPMPVQNDMVMVAPAPWIQQAAAVPVAREQIKDLRGAVAGPKDMKVSGPFEHANLGVFLIHGPDQHKGKGFLTLHEALARGQAVVHDRGMVVVENLSDTDLFIQSGDIVKGGNQDRTIEYDQLLPPRSGPITMAAHCVEQGRSFPRGAESAQQFMSATEQLPTRTLRLANLRNSQQQVWSGVQRTQNNLARSVGVASVRDPLSASSLQLTLENERVLAEVDKYLQRMPVVDGKKNVIGFAIVVNGKIQSADVYASSDLFARLWPKLVRAAAIEALAERSGHARFELPKTQAVQAFLGEPATATGNRRDVSNQVRLISQESAANVMYDTCDLGRQNLVVHRCVLAK